FVPQATPSALPPSASAPSPEAIEQAAKAAIASAMLPISAPEDVTIRPIHQPKPSLFPEPMAVEPPHPEPGAFIPPTPKRTQRGRRAMPRIEDLPVPGQNELRAMRGETPPASTEHPEKRRMGLLQRLASVGLGRKDEFHEEPEAQTGSRP